MWKFVGACIINVAVGVASNRPNHVSSTTQLQILCRLKKNCNKPAKPAAVRTFFYHLLLVTIYLYMIWSYMYLGRTRYLYPVGFKTTLGPRVVVRTTRPQFFYVWCCPTTTTTIYILEDKYPRGVSKYSHVGTHFKALWKCSLKIPFIYLFISFGI